MADKASRTAIHAGQSRKWLMEAFPDGTKMPDDLAFGAFIGVVDIVDCVPASEAPAGPFTEGPWCWLLENPRPLAQPILRSGTQLSGGRSSGRYRADAAARSREKSAARQEIGPLPKVLNRERRVAALASLRVYCESYFKPKFYLAWSPDHLKAIG